MYSTELLLISHVTKLSEKLLKNKLNCTVRIPTAWARLTRVMGCTLEVHAVLRIIKVGKDF